MDPKVKQSWEAFLDPDVIRPRMIAASLFIAAFESLEKCIEDRLRTLFWNGFNKSGEDILSSDYQVKVLSRNRSPVNASLEFMKESGTIDQNDIDAFHRARVCRNKLAHELLSAIGDGLPAEFDQSFADMVALLRKIEVWWILNFEIPINEDFDGQEIDENEITPGPVIHMQLLLDIAFGDEKQSRVYLEEFRKRAKTSKSAAAPIDPAVPPPS